MGSERHMDRTLRTTSYLAMTITTLALITLVVGLVVSARPELGTFIGLTLTSRDGLAIALASGVIAIAGALLGHVLSLLSS